MPLSPVVRGTLALLLALATTAFARRARAAPPSPGEVLGRDDLPRLQGLVSPGVDWLVRRGMEIRVEPYRKVELRRTVREATEKYAAQARLDEDGVLQGWVAGIPFPAVSPDDPGAGARVMYNASRASALADDVGVHLVASDTGVISKAGEAPRFDVERHFLLDWLRSLQFAGRIEVPPLPVIPGDPEGMLRKTAQYPFLEPSDLRGVGLLSFRYLAAGRPDDTWLYLPAQRRVRRVSTAQRGDAMFGQDFDPDSVNVYSGDVASYRWRLLGERRMLGSMHAATVPPPPCERDGGATFCAGWELRPVFVVEGTPRAPGGPVSRRVVHVDAESWLPLYSDVFDASGALWKTVVQHVRWARKPNPVAALEYPEEMGFVVASTVANVQTHHATRTALPGAGTPGEAGWYCNMGERSGNSEEAFSVAALTAAGR